METRKLFISIEHDTANSDNLHLVFIEFIIVIYKNKYWRKFIVDITNGLNCGHRTYAPTCMHERSFNKMCMRITRILHATYCNALLATRHA